MKYSGVGMVELLFVVSVVILTVFGLFLGLDPFEQAKNIRDMSLRKSITTLRSEIINYKTKYGSFPWDYRDADKADGKCGALSGDPKRAYELVGLKLSDPQMKDCLNVLQENTKLKTDFVSSLSKEALESISLTSSDTSKVSLCFLPKGKAMWLEDKTIYDQDGNSQDNQDEDNLDQCEPGWKLIKKTTEMGKNCYVCVN